MTDAPTRVKRSRSLTETLLTIVLGLEAMALLFATLAIFGLARLDPNWLAFIFGPALILVFLMVARLQRYTWGVWVGAALQLVLIALGFVEGGMFVVGGGFLLLWIYCFVKGRQIDARKADWLADYEASTADATASATPEPATASNEGENA